MAFAALSRLYLNKGKGYSLFYRYIFTLKIIRILMLVTSMAFVPTHLAAQDNKKPWAFKIGSWNLLHFSVNKDDFFSKNEKSKLVQRIADIAKNHHIIFFQEIQNGSKKLSNGELKLKDGASVTDKDLGLQSYMPDGWLCDWVSKKTKKSGNNEMFSYCLSPTPTYATGGNVKVLKKVDYMVAGDQTANNGNLKDPEEIWARPPSLIRVSVPRPDEPDLVIDIYDNHIRQCYTKASEKCKDDPKKDSNYTAVRNELKALERNLKDSNHGVLILGDLNADCKTFAPIHRPGRFTNTNGWTWWIDYTNATNLGKSPCAYDRFIGNSIIKDLYITHSIVTKGIPESSDGPALSDHYKIDLTLGHVKKKEELPALLVALVNEGVSEKISKKRKAYGVLDGPNSIKKATLSGINIQADTTTKTSSKLYIVNYDEKVNYGGLVDTELKDFEDRPYSVVIERDGTLSHDLSLYWDDIDPGAYKLILDVDSDGFLNVYKGDIINSSDEIDVLIHSKENHSKSGTVGDNGNWQKIFFEDRTRNIYGIARELKFDNELLRNEKVTGYVISLKLLDDAKVTWADFVQSGGKDLSKWAVPVKILHGPIRLEKVELKHKQLPLVSDEYGRVFDVIWKEPSVLFGLRIIDKHEIARRLISPEDISGSCEDAWGSDDQDLRRMCNVGKMFSDHYGKHFNFVVDVDNDGDFGPSDSIDTYDIDNMAEYFGVGGLKFLGPNSGEIPAVSEYKNFLNARLNLGDQLDQTDVYDQATKNASMSYLQNEVLDTFGFISHVVSDARIGFHIVEGEIYRKEDTIQAGYHEYDKIETRKTDVEPNANVTVKACDIDMHEVNVGEKANLAVISNSITANGDMKGGQGSYAKISALKIELKDGLIAGSRDSFRLVMQATPSLSSRLDC